MHYSCMARVAALYFRLQPKRTEAWYDGSLAALREKPQPVSLPPRGMACRTEDGPQGRVFYLNEGGQGACTVFYLHGGSYIHDFSYFHSVPPSISLARGVSTAPQSGDLPC